jgi:hypothetical protein
LGPVQDTLKIRDNLKKHNVVSGKLPNRPGTLELNCLSAGQDQVSLLHVKDALSNIYFLVDTGAEVSIVPPTGPDLNKPSSMNLIAANGSRIKSYGTRQMTLKINGNQYTWRFQIADVHRSILGADFLRVHGLLVDLANKRLIRLESLSIINGIIKEVPTNVCNITRASRPNEFARLLQGRPELVTPTFSLDSPKHGIWHFIVTHGPPIHAQARRLSPEKLIPTRDEFRTLVELGIARRSNSPHSSPIHVVTKPGGFPQAQLHHGG